MTATRGLTKVSVRSNPVPENTSLKLELKRSQRKPASTSQFDSKAMLSSAYRLTSLPRPFGLEYGMRGVGGTKKGVGFSSGVAGMSSSPFWNRFTLDCSLLNSRPPVSELAKPPTSNFAVTSVRLIAGYIDIGIRGARRRRRDEVVALEGPGHQVFEAVVGVAQAVAQGKAIRKVVLEADRPDVGVGARAVVVGERIVVAALHACRRAVDERNSVVREIVLFLLEVAEREAGRRIDSQTQRRRDAVAVIVHLIAIDPAIA